MFHTSVFEKDVPLSRKCWLAFDCKGLGLQVVVIECPQLKLHEALSQPIVPAWAAF